MFEVSFTQRTNFNFRLCFLGVLFRTPLRQVSAERFDAHRLDIAGPVSRGDKLVVGIRWGLGRCNLKIQTLQTPILGWDLQCRGPCGS